MLLASLLVASMAPTLALMSFNVRYASAKDGPDAWELRKGLVFEAVRRRSPDVLGVQEALAGQVDELLSNLSGYASVGVGRDDGQRAGEFSAVFYRRDRLDLLDSGTYWLSDTPDVAGSKSWGNRVVRICTWARLRTSDRLEFTVLNTHFDHESQPSRENSARLILERLSKATGPVVVMGDLNAGEDNPAVVAFKSGGLRDTFRELHPDETTVGTFTGFDPAATKGDKIDYVFVGPGWRTLEAGIDRWSFDGRLPSDHFPVWAVVALGKA